MHLFQKENQSVDLESYPVVNVSWEDAVAYCTWAELALPSQKQWEKAARGVDGRIYPWGNEWKPYYNSTIFLSLTKPVGYYSPFGDSPFGCVDMVGNVWEWTASFESDLEKRILRGGILGEFSTEGGRFSQNITSDKITAHLTESISTTNYYIGFRVVNTYISGF